jgi:hypothetical protein
VAIGKESFALLLPRRGLQDLFEKVDCLAHQGRRLEEDRGVWQLEDRDSQSA